jgi:glycosyltransferase involved in cell wall biosynthesis
MRPVLTETRPRQARAKSIKECPFRQARRHRSFFCDGAKVKRKLPELTIVRGELAALSMRRGTVGTCGDAPPVLHELVERQSGETGVASSADAKLVILYNHRTQSRDGQFVHIEELIAAMRAEGHEVVVVEPRHVERASFGEDSRVGAAAKRYIPAPLYELMELLYSGREFLRLAAAHRRRRADMLYQRANLFMLSGALFARLFGVPYLLEVNAPIAEERRQFAGLRLFPLARWSERTMWRAADWVLPVTGVLARTIAASGVPGDRITVVPNGVDLDHFAPADGEPMRRELGLGDKLVLGFTGFIREWHGGDTIVSLLASDVLPANSHFLVVGDGPVRDELRAQAARLGIADRLTITGIVPRERVAAYVRCFDIALQPSVVEYASPLKLIEYMALGRAIVAPDRENIRELVAHEESALLVPPGNAMALAAALARLASDPALRQRLGAAARRTIVSRDMTWRHNARRVAALGRAARARAAGAA